MGRSGGCLPPFLSLILLMSPTPKPGLLDISPYVGGRAAVAGVAKVFKLSSNESPLGPSPAALAALQEATSSLALYPEGSALVLREAIGEVYKLDPARIVTSGDGSDALLTMLATFVMAGDWGRYIHLFTIHAFVLGALLAVDAESEPSVLPAPQSPNERRRRRLMVLGCLLALLLYAGTWRVAHYVPPGVNPLRPGWLLLGQPEQRGPGQ